MTTLYNRDFNLWIQQTVSDLKNKDMDAIDWNNLIDEIEGIGKSERRAWQSYLERLIEHLLKLKYWDAERDYPQDTLSLTTCLRKRDHSRR